MKEKETVKNLLTELVEMINNGSQKDLDRADEIATTIIKALDQKPCEDCISRQAVDEAIYDYSRSCDVDYAQIMEYIDKIPSINPQPRKGHWKHNKCDVCGASRPPLFDNFCPNCGAEMEKVESEEKDGNTRFIAQK